MNTDERKIFERIKKKDIEAFEKLFKEFNRPLTLFAQQYVFDYQTGKDIVQENFIHFWENCHKIEIKNSLKAYFYQSVKNRCCNYLRDLQIYDKYKLKYIESLLVTCDPDIFDDPEIHKTLDSAINMLPGEMSKIIRLKYIEKMKIMEVSHLLQISENTVKTQISRGKKKLKLILNDIMNMNFFLIL